MTTGRVVLASLSAAMDGGFTAMAGASSAVSTDGAVPPKPGDTLTIGADVFRVLRAGNLSPAGVDLLYDVQVRR